MLTIENQSEDLEKRNTAASQLTAEKTELLNKVESLQASLRGLEAQVFDLKEDKARIEEQLKSGDDSARVLDEYKKRAQMALKKVQTLSLFLPFCLSYFQLHISSPTYCEMLRSKVHSSLVSAYLLCRFFDFSRS